MALEQWKPPTLQSDMGRSPLRTPTAPVMAEDSVVNAWLALLRERALLFPPPRRLPSARTTLFQAGASVRRRRNKTRHWLGETSECRVHPAWLPPGLMRGSADLRSLAAG